MNAIQRFDIMKTLTDVERVEILNNYEILEKSGVIDDCLLRKVTDEVFNKSNMSLSLTMSIIANDCYRHFSNKYLALKE